MGKHFHTIQIQFGAVAITLPVDLFEIDQAQVLQVAPFPLMILDVNMPGMDGFEFIRQLRQEQSVPILAKIKAWLDENIKLVLPRSPMAQAIQYTLNQWEALCRYCEHGWLDIDNNAAERAVKRIAIGRKNWLFAGHDTAAPDQHARNRRCRHPSAAPHAALLSYAR